MNVRDAAALIKPRPTLMATAAAFLGYTLAADPRAGNALLFHALCGSFLVGAGSAVLNQVMERERDARMKRTRLRPVASGRVSPAVGLAVGTVLSAAGVVELGFLTHPLAGWVAAVLLVIYLGLYTPLKSRTPGSFWAGAVAGGLPPVVGWTAARGSIDEEALILFLILFTWQLPHFLAIAWLYREDYAVGGFSILGGAQPDPRLAARWIALTTAGVVIWSGFPVLTGMMGAVYGWMMLAAGTVFLAFSCFLLKGGLERHARRYVLTSVAYLGVLYGAMLLDRTTLY